MNKKNYHVDNKSFLVYKEWEPLLGMLSGDEDAGKLFKALFAFAMRGEVPEFTGTLKMAFYVMSSQLERDGLKWEEKCEKNAANGAKGGRPRKDKTASQPENSDPLPEKPVKEEETVVDEPRESSAEHEKETDDPVQTACAEAPLPVKKTYGKHKNVLLTDEEFKGLKLDHPLFSEKYIDKLSEYMLTSGKKYGNHAAVIRKWIREDCDIYKSDSRPDSELTPIELYSRMADNFDPSMLISAG